MKITRDELEALKRALLSCQDAIKIAVKSPKFRTEGGPKIWNRACTTIDGIVRNVESTDYDSDRAIVEPMTLRRAMKQAHDA